jgi:hypothetical protein
MIEYSLISMPETHCLADFRGGNNANLTTFALRSRTLPWRKIFPTRRFASLNIAGIITALLLI